ncbi:hypothetical protein [Bordetella hinzii]|uniref:hypothetical protein n=1 Tax=Bordetella hinzii TaxID=103855 RepID=UPI003BF802A6
MLLYRADQRTPELMRRQFPEGFKPWRSLGLAEVRALIGLFIGMKSAGAIPRDLAQQFGPAPQLRDLSVYIKWTKDKSSTFWVSTAVNPECGGQGCGAPIYEIRDETLGLYQAVKGGVQAIGARSSNLKPALVLNSPSLSGATLIGLHHGPVHDAEVSFFTPIPLSIVSSRGRD